MILPQNSFNLNFSQLLHLSSKLMNKEKKLFVFAFVFHFLATKEKCMPAGPIPLESNQRRVA